MKSSVRNRLSAAQMSRLLTVQLHSADISEFDPMAAIHRWNSTSSRARRPTRMDVSVQEPLVLEQAESEKQAEKTPLDSDEQLSDFHL